jgi:GNAT superfamily N-acetyltransferase
MRYRLRRADPMDADDVASLRDLHRATFEDTAPLKDPGGSLIFEKGAWWLMHPEDTEFDPIGFCGVVPSTYGAEYAYLKRGGILSAHRGQGLQGRLIRVRCDWARRKGFRWAITETGNDNVASSNSLIRAGFRPFWPEVPWGVKTALYLRKPL